jgi:ribose transport system substrate-binding protein
MSAVAIAAAGLSAQANSAGAASSSASSQAAKAQAATNKWSTPPVLIGDTQRLKTKPPSGKTIVWLQCEFASCTTAGQGVSSAAAAVGWSTKIIPYQASNPATLIAAMKTALQYQPTAVVLSGVPQSAWGSEVPAYKAAGVPIIPISAGPGAVNSTVIANINPPTDFATAGTIFANWFIATSAARGHVLLQAVPSFPIFNAFAKGFQAAVKKGCTQCQVTVLNNTITDADNNAVVPDIVSALQKDQSIKYVVGAFAAYLTGLRTALSAAGLANGVRIAGAQGSIVDQQNILAGTESVTTPSQLRYMGWMSVDITLHNLQKMPITKAAQSVPNMLLTKSNIGTPQADYITPSSYQKQFKVLWRVG